MKYDFTATVDRRNSGSEKWNLMTSACPDVPSGIVPLSVADMEFRMPPPIVNGLKKWLDDCVLGYTVPTDAYYDSVTDWMRERHGFTPEREHFVLSPGVVPAIFNAVESLTERGDGVIITPPVYYPFRMAVENAGRRLVEVPLVPDGDTYCFDLSSFRKAAADPSVKLFILCSPHNPVGRVWTRKELEEICDICLENNVFVVSDEIHSDLIMPGYTHTSVAALDTELVRNAAVCTAPTKTFNLAGLQCSNIFVADPIRRAALTAGKEFDMLNAFAFPACILAYRECGDWLDELITVIDTNRRLFSDALTAKIPGVKTSTLQGTYLLWADFRFLGLDDAELERFMQSKARIFTDEGYMFGTGGSGFERFNLACPTSVLENAAQRLADAIGAAV